MKGKVLGFDAASGSGAITGEDGKRYSFTAADNKSPAPLKPNDSVDFEVDGAAAKNIYAVKTGFALPTGGGAPGAPGAPAAGGDFMQTVMAKPNIIWAAIVVLGGLLWGTSPFNQAIGMMGGLTGGGISGLLNTLIWAVPVIAGVLIFFEVTNHAMTPLFRQVASYAAIGGPIVLPILAGMLAGPMGGMMYGFRMDIGTILMIGGGVLILLTSMGILKLRS